MRGERAQLAIGESDGDSLASAQGGGENLALHGLRVMRQLFGDGVNAFRHIRKSAEAIGVGGAGSDVSILVGVSHGDAGPRRLPTILHPVSVFILEFDYRQLAQALIAKGDCAGDARCNAGVDNNGGGGAEVAGDCFGDGPFANAAMSPAHITVIVRNAGGCLAAACAGVEANALQRAVLCISQTIAVVVVKFEYLDAAGDCGVAESDRGGHVFFHYRHLNVIIGGD